MRMSRMDVKIHTIRSNCHEGYWADRIVGQLTYGAELDKLCGGKYEDVLCKSADYVLEQIKAEGCISKQAGETAEGMLSVMSADAKRYTLMCVAHAHIDMNWMWRFDETVSVTLDTFQTMLDLLREYPDFTFAQSQASCYKIVEEYGSQEMLDEIRERVKEGRWEVTASTWVEADKNMPNGESMARHLLYTRQYLSNLLDVPKENFQLDFEPDTFGHSANLPEILSKAGIKYYYHCRGSVDPQLQWWHAPSGERVLIFMDGAFYNSVIDGNVASRMLAPCRELGIDTMLKVYGVGDHGGGPSRRDIDRLHDMQSWPVYPTIEFATYRKFFQTIESRFGDQLPHRDTELNPVFTGCYTTQTRIKLANRVGERTLMEAEEFAASAALKTGFAYQGKRFETAWEKILFNQFHDIVTGSGVIDTREYAMGQFQESIALANTQKLQALRAIAAQIDTSAYDCGTPSFSRSEGAGVGNGIADFKISQVDRGYGDTRIYHVFNAATCARHDNVEITVWDWSGADIPLIAFYDEKGNKVAHQVLQSGTEHYWGHDFVRVLVDVEAPACGYSTYILRKSEDSLSPMHFGEPGEWQWVEAAHDYVLENKFLRVQLDLQTAEIVSMLDKTTGRELLREGGRGGFRIIDEDTDRGMTAWRVGRLMNIKHFDSVRIRPVGFGGTQLRKGIAIEAKWSRSTLRAVLMIDELRPGIWVDVTCDWHEIGNVQDGMPELRFTMPIAQKAAGYKYDVPAGVLQREEADMDLPGNSFIAVVPEEEGTSLMLSSDSKYGYRGFHDEISVNLIRASYDPDPYPEYGIHKIKLYLGLADASDNGALVENAFCLWHELNALPGRSHKGTMPLSQSFMQCSGDAVIQGVKLAEDGSGDLIVRLYNVSGKNSECTLSFAWELRGASFANIHEESNAERPVHTQGNQAQFTLEANRFETLRLSVAK